MSKQNLGQRIEAEVVDGNLELSLEIMEEPIKVTAKGNHTFASTGGNKPLFIDGKEYRLNVTLWAYGTPKPGDGTATF